MSKTTFNINATSQLSVSAARALAEPFPPCTRARFRGAIPRPRRRHPRRVHTALTHALAHSTLLQSDNLSAFLARRLEGNLTEVPLIGPKMEEKLVAAGINTTFQLCGKFMSFKESPDTTSVEMCNAFYAWLAASGVTHGRNAITLAIAEKVAIAFPACFNAAEFVKGDAADEE